MSEKEKQGIKAQCVICGNSFTEQEVIKSENRAYCKKCLDDEVRAGQNSAAAAPEEYTMESRYGETKQNCKRCGEKAYHVCLPLLDEALDKWARVDQEMQQKRKEFVLLPGKSGNCAI